MSGRIAIAGLIVSGALLAVTSGVSAASSSDTQTKATLSTQLRQVQKRVDTERARNDRLRRQVAEMKKQEADRKQQIEQRDREIADLQGKIAALQPARASTTGH